MIQNALFSVLAVAVVIALHLYINESVEGAYWLLLLGASAGVLFSLVCLCVVYVVRGQLAIEINGKRWSDRSFWFHVTLVLFVVGNISVFGFNAVQDLRPYKIESWKVTYNGPRTMRQLNPLASRFHRGMDERVLQLSNGERRLTYSYLPGVALKLPNAACGSEVKVRLQMGGLGLFRVEGVSVE